VLDEEEYKEKTSASPYMYLMLDIPPSPLYKDEYQQNIIPQVCFNKIVKACSVMKHASK